MATHNRSARIAHQIQKEVSELLLRRVKDPRVKFVTITRVSVSPDLSFARLYFSAPANDERSKEELEKGLSSAKGYIRSELGKRLLMRRVPQIEFVFDSQYEAALRVSDEIAKMDNE